MSATGRVDADLRAVGDRIEVLLEELRTAPDPRTWPLVSEAVELITDLYGAGLARVVELVAEDEVRRLAADDLVASLLVLHGLHPLGLAARVGAALEELRPTLAERGAVVELLGFDEAEGVAHVRVIGSGDGCASSPVTIAHAVRQVVEAAAPELAGVDVVDGTPSPPPRPVPITVHRKQVRTA